MTKQKRHPRRMAAAALALAVGLLASVTAMTEPAAANQHPHGSFTGTIDGADYRAEVPENWNGTLVLYSHGYHPEGWPNDIFGIEVTNSPHTEAWLLDHGYALAASLYQNEGIGYLVEDAQQDQIGVLDWFADEIGDPETTISYGQSQGATIATLLVERHPDRFDGLANICGSYDPSALYNSALDVNFVVKTLLAPDADIDLVSPDDPDASTAALVAAIAEARTTDEGRARLALAASMSNVVGWYRAHQPRPTDMEQWINQQADWMANAYASPFGPAARDNLESQVGGNPSGNVGIDYRHQLARSAQTHLVVQAYQEAGLDLRDDLAQLNAAPRIAPDPTAVDFIGNHSPVGSTPVPTISIHTTGDGGAVTDSERWYASQVRRNGDPSDLRQIFIERGQHCSMNAAEEATTLVSLVDRVESGSWPKLSPHRLNREVSEFAEPDSPYYLVRDFGDPEFGEMAMDPAFTGFTPPKPMRPTC